MAIESFDILESENRRVPCCEPELLRNAEVGKKLLNFQINEWSEGVAEGISTIPELKDHYKWLPRWVFIAVLKQSKKIMLDRWSRTW